MAPALPTTLHTGMKTAFALARATWGAGASAGLDYTLGNGPCVIGKKVAYGRWERRGVGSTWDEAFADATKAKPWPNGPPPARER